MHLLKCCTHDRSSHKPSLLLARTSGRDLSQLQCPLKVAGSNRPIDFGNVRLVGMTKDEAWSVATKRNLAQVDRARADVERLRRELADAEAHLARVEVALPYR